MIINIKLIAHVRARTVYRDTLPFKTVENNEGNELFREMVGPVIIGTVSDSHRQTVRIMPRAHKMIARSLRRGIRRMRSIRRILSEEPFFAERAVHLIS